MWHQVTLRHWRIIRKQESPDPLSRKAGHAWQVHTLADLGVARKSRGQTAHTLPAPTPSPLLFPSLPPVTSCEAPDAKSNEGKCSDGRPLCSCTSRTLCSISAPPSSVPEKPQGRKGLPTVRTYLERHICVCVPSAWADRWPEIKVYVGSRAADWRYDQDRGKNRIGNRGRYGCPHTRLPRGATRLG